MCFDIGVLFAGPLEGIGVRNFIQPLILKTECTATTSAWKSPRVLSGYLASTAQSSQGESTLGLKAARRFPPRRNSVSPNNPFGFASSSLLFAMIEEC